MNFGNSVAEIQQKYEREREKVVMLLSKQGNFFFFVAIVAMPLPKIGGKKIMVAKIQGGIKKKNYYVYNSFTTFLQQIIVINYYQFKFEFNTEIIFLIQ